jgi:hypothetical protein
MNLLHFAERVRKETLPFPRADLSQSPHRGSAAAFPDSLSPSSPIN